MVHSTYIHTVHGDAHIAHGDPAEQWMSGPLHGDPDIHSGCADLCMVQRQNLKYAWCTII